MRIIWLLIWIFFAKFIPGHGLKNIFGRFRSMVGSACLARAGTNTVIGSYVDFGKGTSVFLGDYSGIGDGSIVKGGAKIMIGNHVVMGPGTMILSSTHNHSIQNGKWMDDRCSAPISIGDECFIGAGAILLAGVSIGPRSVVSAGSVVTRDVPEGVIVGGSPASFIKKVPRSLRNE